MKIRMLQDVADAYGGVYRTGEEYELAPQLAKAWLENGHAEPVATKRVDRAERR